MGRDGPGRADAGRPAHSARAARDRAACSSQSLLDVRVSRSIPLGRAGRVELIFDVLNVLGEAAEESLVTDSLYTYGIQSFTLNPNFGRPAVFRGSSSGHDQRAHEPRAVGQQADATAIASHPGRACPVAFRLMRNALLSSIPSIIS